MEQKLATPTGDKFQESVFKLRELIAELYPDMDIIFIAAKPNGPSEMHLKYNSTLPFQKTTEILEKVRHDMILKGARDEK